MSADLDMNSPLRSLAILVLVMLVSGCQVCRITNQWNDKVDDIANCDADLDRWYRPHWDLSREYRPDGGDHWLFRRCSCNDQLCP